MERSPSPTKKSPPSPRWGSPFSAMKKKSGESSRNERESLTFGQAGAMSTSELPLDNESRTPMRQVFSNGETTSSARSPVTVGTLGNMKGRTKGESLASEVFFSEHYTVDLYLLSFFLLQPD